MTSKLFIGMMSGTSVDGIDAALVRINSVNQLNVIDTQFTEFDSSLRDEINAIAQAKELQNCHNTNLHQRLAEHYAQAAIALIHKAGLNRGDISAVANHGQTVRHEPNATPPFSLQLGDPQLIANKTGILTVANFRQADLLAGGQGAPLMPAFHAKLFSGENRFLLNIGGIANVSYLGKNIIGYDTGPGNTLLDQWVYQNLGTPYDSGGKWAASGKVIPQLLRRLLSDPYFSQQYPKSTGPDYFNLNWVGDVSAFKPEDVQATLMALTVQSIADQITCIAKTGEVFVCGGGAHNTLIMKQLAESLTSFNINTTDALGIAPDWIEAVGFAWLGYCRINEKNSNLPSVTGAKKTVSLGDIFLPNKA